MGRGWRGEKSDEKDADLFLGHGEPQEDFSNKRGLMECAF